MPERANHKFIFVNEAVLVVVPELSELHAGAVPVSHLQSLRVSVEMFYKLRQRQPPVTVLNRFWLRHTFTWSMVILTMSRSAMVSSLLTLYMCS